MSWFDIVKRLRGNQKNLDTNKDGKLDADDFKRLRNKKELQAKASKNIKYTDTEKVAPAIAAIGAGVAGAANLVAGKKKKKE
jgi:hypothetical protein